MPTDKDRKYKVAPEEEKTKNQPLAILYLYRLLYENTDEDHGMSAQELIDGLQRYGISLRRQAVGNYIGLLADVFGADIERPGNGSRSGYKMLSRELSLAEVKVLADAVAAARFITADDADELIGRLKNFVSRHQASSLRRQVYVSGRVKGGNENVTVNVDWLHQAVAEHRKVAFDYCEYDTSKKLVMRGERRVCTPYALAWSDDRYYLVASHPVYGIANFRVDHMRKIVILDESADPVPEKYVAGNREIAFDLPKYLNPTFSMFSGAEEQVTLIFDKSLVGVVLDKFGYDTRLIPEDGGERFRVHVGVKTEHPEPFFAWLFQFGRKALIASPDTLREKYEKALNDALAQYTQE